MVWLKIDEVANRTGLTKRTIRYYEELGILAPPERSEGRVRLYTDAHIERLQKIVNAKDVLGCSLQELQLFNSIGSTLDAQRQDYKLHYKDSADIAERKSRLLEMDLNASKQLELIALKIDKIHELRTDLEDLRIRIREGIAKLDDERK
ncbi:MerR family transcriptional regulator [Paenibacillus psychroresistens]|uniref:MerR family transcriptional regulator n=1 Tax=Paenibacillus psychroresistens TaxID=1778678 RepID=A0A6B8RTN8_9BACL|nr:MerR family transcriptional regulator [Paenibacillus psychroresistens]QGQ98935.1 MerR family transcriptional regulator [Paenibacillus psychroresistens]